MTHRPSPLKHTSWCDFAVSSGTSCTNQGFASCPGKQLRKTTRYNNNKHIQTCFYSKLYKHIIYNCTKIYNNHPFTCLTLPSVLLFKDPRSSSTLSSFAPPALETLSPANALKRLEQAHPCRTRSADSPSLSRLRTSSRPSRCPGARKAAFKALLTEALRSS